MAAARKRHLDVSKYLAGLTGERGAHSVAALMVSAENGQLEVVKYLTGERGVAADATLADGRTALILAAQNGQLDVVKYLAGERGASIEAKQATGATALMVAAGTGHLDAVKYSIGVLLDDEAKSGRRTSRVTFRFQSQRF